MIPLLLALVYVETEVPCQLHDVHRFPPREVACEAIYFNAKMGRLLWVQNHDLECERRWAYECWDWLYAARGGECDQSEEYLLRSLMELRWRIGDEAYFRGVMPPVVPHGLLRSLD